MQALCILLVALVSLCAAQSKAPTVADSRLAFWRSEVGLNVRRLPDMLESFFPATGDVAVAQLHAFTLYQDCLQHASTAKAQRRCKDRTRMAPSLNDIKVNNDTESACANLEVSVSLGDKATDFKPVETWTLCVQRPRKTNAPAEEEEDEEVVDLD